MAGVQALSPLMEQRIRNQIGRVFRNTFGAEEGLCTLVERATDQMLSVGMSRQGIHTCLSRLVNECAPDTDTSADSRSQVLARNVVRWSDRTRTTRVSA